MSSSSAFSVSTSLAPAIVFVVLYGIIGTPLVIWRSIVEKFAVSSFSYLLVFSFLRCLAFIFKAVLSQNPAEWDAIASGVLLAAGFFLLPNVFAIYLLKFLTLIKQEQAKHDPTAIQFIPGNLLELASRLAQGTGLYVMAASGVSSAGAVLQSTASSQSDADQALLLRKIGAFLFLAVVSLYTIIFVVLGSFSAGATPNNNAHNTDNNNVWNRIQRRQKLMQVWLAPIGTLLIIRCLYTVIYLYTTNTNFTGDEGYYPMSATLEFIALCILLLPNYAREMETLNDTARQVNEKPASTPVSAVFAASDKPSSYTPTISRQGLESPA